ncbi:hypothetical protein NP511_18425 [Natrinema thermotolerans]|uniref:Uncharacterized protein n=1 Tax=Natrinema thermotolerans TaxID=121872 RepID=A0AAF0T0S9_9EURY|nr:hypothetical protein [Natrinema thermotolerans]QCC60325.1 hypothetical protein DVR14_17475 [Natrinema thermotolerans]QCC61234.1 hypothetical protein DVR14_21605 [Natrinema thermotolerans]WMT07350.1 hypothetical protein NP511_18425 [Natrinema thermotolerans]
MASVELPSRAKPKALHTLCRHLHEVSGSEKIELYDQLDIDQRQVRSAINYGAKLGFLTVEDDYIQNTNRGSGISYSENIDEKPVQTAFQEAIEFYEPYRDTLLRIHAGNLVEKINGNPAIKQSTFKEKAEASTGDEHTDREINLLIKTAQASGIGEFVTGRKGFETRLEVSDQYGAFIEELTEEYPTPEPEETVEEESTEADADAGSVADSVSAEVDEMALKADGAGEKLKLKVEYDVTDRSETQIINLVQHIRSTE